MERKTLKTGNTKKVVSVCFRANITFLFALMLLFSYFVTPVFAEEKEETASTALDGSAQANGISVTTTTDKESYKDGETAVLTVSVKNTNDYDLSDIKIDFSVPKNFDLTDKESRTQTIDVLAAGESKDFQLTATVTEDPNALLVESVAKFSSTALIAALIAAIILIAMIYIINLLGGNHKTPKPPKKAISSILVIALLTASMSSMTSVVSVSAFTEEGLAEEGDFSRVVVHDPSIVKDPETGTYYIFGSHRAFAKTDNLIGWKPFQLNISTDYETVFKEPWTSWSQPASPNASLSGMMWAPDVIWNDTMKKWCMYMSINGDNWCSSICLLTADNIEGPYTFIDEVVYSGINNPRVQVDPAKTDIYKVLGEDADLERYAQTSFSCINAIDPCVRYDENGDLYMSYGSWSAGIYMLKLDKETGLRDYTTTYETERDVSDAYLGIKIAGGYYNSGEASYIIHAGDYYYLFMSYAALEAMGGYQMRIFRSKEITGPYVDQNGVNAIWKKAEDIKKTGYGVKIFGSYEMSGLQKVQVAQGHNSAFVDDDGKIYVVYHTRFQSDNGRNEGHQVRVHQLFLTEDDWLVAAPYEYSGETLPEEGYSNNDVCMTYDFIYHEPTKYYQVVGNVQLGIVGNEEQTTKTIEGIQKEMIVAHRQAIVEFNLSYTHEGAEKVALHKDGTVTGDYTGTWKFTEGANVEMVLNNVTYKGIFIKQQDEATTRDMRMTFTILGDNITVWGVQTGDLHSEDTTVES